AGAPRGYITSRNFCRNWERCSANMMTFKVTVTVERRSMSKFAARDLSYRTRSGIQEAKNGFPLVWE
ncbi:MAG: hypothetical protein ACPL7J_14725, partial [Desulfomonilaceae bacterium]